MLNVKNTIRGIYLFVALGTLSAWGSSPGGSNYGWYQIDGCNREPYGVIYNYNTASSTINSQLQQMYNNGQRRLRIPIYHARGVSTGTVMDSTGGTLQPQFLTNLTNLLNEIEAIGYQEIEVSFHPQATNDPTSWASFSEDYYQENWNLIYNLHPIIAGSGILYRIDLLNEGIPTSTQSVLLQYDQRLWGDYVNTFGKTDDTVGFSIIADPNRISQMPSVYNDPAHGAFGAPYLFDVHIYDETTATFQTAYTAITAAGYSGTGWIIGEAYYNDALEGSSLTQAVNSTGQLVFYVLQWPLTDGSSCSGVNIAPPATFANYSANGW